MARPTVNPELLLAKSVTCVSSAAITWFLPFFVLSFLGFLDTATFEVELFAPLFLVFLVKPFSHSPSLPSLLLGPGLAVDLLTIKLSNLSYFLSVVCFGKEVKSMLVLLTTASTRSPAKPLLDSSAILELDLVVLKFDFLLPATSQVSK
jgi:hypothetical protein